MPALGVTPQRVCSGSSVHIRQQCNAAQQAPAAASSLGFGANLSSRRLRDSSRLRTCAARRQACVLASSEGGNPLAKLGRVLQEKAKADFERVFQARGRSSDLVQIILQEPCSSNRVHATYISHCPHHQLTTCFRAGHEQDARAPGCRGRAPNLLEGAENELRRPVASTPTCSHVRRALCSLTRPRIFLRSWRRLSLRQARARRGLSQLKRALTTVLSVQCKKISVIRTRSVCGMSPQTSGPGRA